MTQPIRFIMVGGFLGAGKTTLVAELARRFQADGKHVCIVTNDQAAGLVDTELLRSKGLNVSEVAGSCFCCNFHGLTDAMESFESVQRPDVILAEPVGSCTDLVATIAIPMMEQLGEKFVHSPYAVVLKPSHGIKILSGEGKRGFSEKAEYIFRKQLEEAELILINRVDELEDAQQDLLRRSVEEQYPGRPVLFISAKTGQNVDALYEALAATSSPRGEFMSVDYDVYAEGEAELGWLNATLTLHSEDSLSIDAAAMRIVDTMRDKLLSIDAEPAHLKVLCSGADSVAVANLVSSDTPTMLSVSSDASGMRLSVIINARVCLDPESLEGVVSAAIGELATELGATAEIESMESFRPGRPVPTYRAGT